MSSEENDIAVVVEEEVSITVISEPVTPPARTRGSSWVWFWILSAFVGILGVFLFWLPAQRQDKLWGVNTNETIVLVGDDVCRRVSGPSFCNDAVIDKNSGLAFLACDPFKPSFYPPYELYNSSCVYGNGGLWVYDTNDPSSPPIKLPFRKAQEPPHGFHPISLSISPVEKVLPPGYSVAEQATRLLVISYPDSITQGVVEVIDYYLPPLSFLTFLFGIKHTILGGELSYVATIRSDHFTAPAGIVAVSDQPSLLSEIDNHAIPSFYLTNTYRGSGLSRTIIEKGLKISRGDLVFYNAKAEIALPVGFGLDRPHSVTTDDNELGTRVYVSTQDGIIHLFERLYIDPTGAYVSQVPAEDHKLQGQSVMHPSRNEVVEIFNPTFLQSSYFKTRFPIVGIAALPPAPSAFGGEMFIISSPKHYRFDSALRLDEEDTVPVSILRLSPFQYVFNQTTIHNDKIYEKNDPRLRTGVRGDKNAMPERKRWWEASTLWTDVDFGAGPGGIAVKEDGNNVVILGLGGGKKGGIVLCSVERD